MSTFHIPIGNQLKTDIPSIRELLILQQFVYGMRNKDIANKNRLDSSEISSLFSELRERYKCKTNLQLVTLVARNRWLDLEKINYNLEIPFRKQKQLLSYLAAGFCITEVAEKLGETPNAIQCRVKRLCWKYKVKTPSALIWLAYCQDWIR